MKSGIVSDSHDHVGLLRRALEALCAEGAEAILHAGDLVAPFSAKVLAEIQQTRGVPVHCIYGNNDGERAGLKRVLPQIQDGPLRLNLGGVPAVMCHSLEELLPEDLQAAKVVIFGHTHECLAEVRQGVLYLNPGECCGVLTGRCTAAVLDTETMTARIVEVES